MKKEKLFPSSFHCLGEINRSADCLYCNRASPYGKYEGKTLLHEHLFIAIVIASLLVNVIDASNVISLQIWTNDVE